MMYGDSDSDSDRVDDEAEEALAGDRHPVTVLDASS